MQGHERVRRATLDRDERSQQCSRGSEAGECRRAPAVVRRVQRCVDQGDDRGVDHASGSTGEEGDVVEVAPGRCGGDRHGRLPFDVDGTVPSRTRSHPRPEGGEYVTLRNVSGSAVDVSGYFLRDAANNILRVGEGYTLQPGTELRVHTGPGTSSSSAYFNGLTASVLNNTGDSLGLWSPDLRLVDVYAN